MFVWILERNSWACGSFRGGWMCLCFTAWCVEFFLSCVQLLFISWECLFCRDNEHTQMLFVLVGTKYIIKKDQWKNVRNSPWNTWVIGQRINVIITATTATIDYCCNYVVALSGHVIVRPYPNFSFLFVSAFSLVGCLRLLWHFLANLFNENNVSVDNWII